MKNYLASDFYVLKKMKIIFILPIIALVLLVVANFTATRLNFLALGMSDMQDMVTAESDGNIGEEVKSSFKVGFEAGLKTQTQKMKPVTIKDIFSGGAMYKSSAADLFETQTCGLTGLMFVAIFAAFFYGSQIRGNFTKNILKFNENRWISFASKTIVVFTYVIIFYVFVFLVSVLCNATMCKKFSLGIDGGFVRFFAIQLLLAFAMCTITGLISVLTTSAVGMIFAIITSSGLLNLAFLLVDILVNKVIVPGAKFSISNYLITGNIAATHIDTTGGDLVRPIIVALAFLVVGFVGTGYINAKRDIH